MSLLAVANLNQPQHLASSANYCGHGRLLLLLQRKSNKTKREGGEHSLSVSPTRTLYTLALRYDTANCLLFELRLPIIWIFLLKALTSWANISAMISPILTKDPLLLFKLSFRIKMCCAKWGHHYGYRNRDIMPFLVSRLLANGYNFLASLWTFHHSVSHQTSDRVNT